MRQIWKINAREELQNSCVGEYWEVILKENIWCGNGIYDGISSKNLSENREQETFTKLLESKQTTFMGMPQKVESYSSSLLVSSL